MRFHPPSIFFPGTVLCGVYEVVRFLGYGSSGMVYLCKHRELNNHLVAMKVLTIESESEVERLKREILATYQINHANVIRPYELITAPDLVAFTMEYAGGESLAERIGREGRLEYKQIVDILQATCSGLEAIHGVGVVHRDLKPSNILLTPEGNIKITDFGTARLDRSSGLSPRGMLGTLEYVSPEYVEHGHIDARSDLYSLGVLAYELITGVVPFRSEAPGRALCMRVSESPEPLQKLRPDCPLFLTRIVERALEAKPAARYQTAAAMRADIEKLQDFLNRKNVLEPKHKPQQAEAETLTKTKRRRKNTRRSPRNDFGLRFRYPTGPSLPQVFAASSLVVWLVTVGVWLYMGQHEMFFR